MIFSTGSDNSFPFRLVFAGEGIATAQTPLIERTDFEYCTAEYVRSGRGILECGGRRYECGPDCVYLLHHHSNHRYWPEKEDPWNKLFFMVEGTLADQLFRAYGIQDVDVLPEAGELRHFFDAFWRIREPEPDLHRKAAVLFHQFAEAMARMVRRRLQPSELPAALILLKRRLDGELGDAFLLEEFAQEQGVSTAHLIRSFREAFGCPPMEYRLRRKQAAAELLLAHSLLSVKEIARELGFCDQYAFSKFFRGRRGVSPGVFRKG